MNKCEADEFLASRKPLRLQSGPWEGGGNRWSWTVSPWGDGAGCSIPEWLVTSAADGPNVAMLLYVSPQDAMEALATTLSDWRKENGHL